MCIQICIPTKLPKSGNMDFWKSGKLKIVNYIRSVMAIHAQGVGEIKLPINRPGGRYVMAPD